MPRCSRIQRRKAASVGQVSSSDGRRSGGRTPSSRRWSMKRAAAPCGARAVLLPRNTEADAAKPAASVSISKPAARTQSPHKASKRTTSVMVAGE
ncbi:hypothetical protein ACVWY5_000136 [Bradyrhizobium sp. USDA 3256]